MNELNQPDRVIYTCLNCRYLWGIDWKPPANCPGCGLVFCWVYRGEEPTPIHDALVRVQLTPIIRQRIHGAA